MKPFPQEPLFVTGTGTGVGKTHVAAALLAGALDAGFPAAYIKPVQTGSAEGPIDADTVGGWLRPQQASCLTLESYALAASPHLAARCENRECSVAGILGKWESNLSSTPHHPMIVEGAGGLMVPLNPRETMLDLIQALNATTILVTSPTLGTLNHTLLSAGALKAAGRPLAGFIVSEPEPITWGIIETDNIEYLERVAGLPFLGILPYLDPTHPDSRQRLRERGRAFWEAMNR